MAKPKSKVSSKSNSSKGLVAKSKFKFDKTLMALIAAVVVATGGYLFYQGSHAAGVPCIKQTLRTGSSGACVSDLQYMLNAAAPIIKTPLMSVNGKYSATTAFTVGAYQKLHGMTVDGVTGTQTWLHLCQNYAWIELLTGGNGPTIQKAALAADGAGCPMQK